MRKSERVSKDVDALLEQAVSQVRSSEPDPKQVEAAASRVWQQLGSDSAMAAAGAAEIDEIRGCEDYQALIPAFLADSLPEARKLLLQDHTRECIPCRRALKEAREGKAPAPIRRRSAKVAPFPGPALRWALAAMLVVGVSAALYFLSGAVLYSGPAATIKTADGQLFRVTETAHLPIAVGEEILPGEVVRTGRDGGAVMRLSDGSLVEIRERSEVSIRESHRGTTIDLGRGNVIVQAAKQRNRHLFVGTADCEVAVTGTIFSVNHGTKGSRVSVVEGHVRVAHAGRETKLHPGEQLATQAYLGQVPVEQDIKWSRDLDTYIALLKEYRTLRQELAKQVPPPGLRHSQRLLDLMPEGTVLYAALPNLSESVTKTHQVISQQVQESPVLQQWWDEQREHVLPIEPIIDEIVEKIGIFGEFLGKELAVGGQSGSGNWGEDFSGPLVLAEIVDAAGFQAFIEGELSEHDISSDNVAFLDDPFATPPDAEIYLWLSEDLVVGSPHIDRIRQVASFVSQGAANPFVGSDFHQRVAELYQEGVNILIAADLEEVIAAAVEAMDSKDGESKDGAMVAFERLGVLNAQHLMIEQRHLGKTQHRAVLTFSEERQGIASWLAAPAPMGALDFVSAEAKLFGAFVFKNPEAMMKDLSSFADKDELDNVFREFKERLGLDLNDFIEVLGGEFAFAVDGPLLPTPSWKLILEVYDPARFQFIVEQAIAELNTHLLRNGQNEVEIVEEEIGGRTYYSLPLEMAEVQYAIHYTFVDGYLVAAPSRALLDMAIRYSESGYSITESSKFRELLPVDGQNNFSALVFQDLASLMGEAAKQFGQGLLTSEQQAAISELTDDAKPTLAYAYAEDRRIIAAAQSESSVMDAMVQGMLGLENPLGFVSILSELPIDL